jgi:IS5 family transposase
MITTIFCVLDYFCKAKEDCVFYIDSTILRVCHNKRIAQNRVFAGIAQRGKSSMGWFFGFKFHYVINTQGEIVKFLITPGNVSDKNHDLVEFLTGDITGKLFGDKGYISAPLFKKLFSRGLQIITKIKRNMKSVGNLLKNKLQIEHSRHRSIIGFFINVLASVVAYNFLPRKPSILSQKKQIQ